MCLGRFLRNLNIVKYYSTILCQRPLNTNCRQQFSISSCSMYCHSPYFCCFFSYFHYYPPKHTCENHIIIKCIFNFISFQWSLAPPTASARSTLVRWVTVLTTSTTAATSKRSAVDRIMRLLMTVRLRWLRRVTRSTKYNSLSREKDIFSSLVTLVTVVINLDNKCVMSFNYDTIHLLSVHSCSGVFISANSRC